MQAYRIRRGANIDGLERFDYNPESPAANEVRVRVHAVALNYRDLLIARNNYLGSNNEPLVPVSDGAGEVVAVGSAVTRFRVGDRVTAAFFPAWIDGPPTPEKTATGLGGGIAGMLAEEVLLPESALVAMPAHLSYAEAATLPCAGVTAWNALFVTSQIRPGDTVLLLGTGGVSIWALQLAKAAGLRTIITSSDDAKLERARALGADQTINYRRHPEWGQQVLELTSQRGVDLVLEVGGQGTLRQSIAATRMGGTVALIGGVSGFGGELEPFALIGGAQRLAGVLVGSRAMADDLGRFVGQAGIKPVIDRVFSFDQAREAYRYLDSGRHFGKIVIALDA